MNIEDQYKLVQNALGAYGVLGPSGIESFTTGRIGHQEWGSREWAEEKLLKCRQWARQRQLTNTYKVVEGV